MANEKHIELLRSDAEAWNEWRKGRPKEVPDLSHSDLVGLDLRGRNLQSADLRKAILDRSNLADVNLEGANLHGAHLDQTNFEGANLKGALLIDAHGVAIKANSADLWSANLEEAELPAAQFAGARLTSANLKKAQLRGANLQGANLSGSDFEGAMLDVAMFTGAKLDFASLRNASLTHSRFSGASLQWTVLNEANLHSAQGLRLDYTFVKGAIFDSRSKDPWSVLRRVYSGPRLAFNLLFLVAFLIPYVAKVLFWVSINRAQTITEAAVSKHATLVGLAPDSLDSYALCLFEQCERMRVLQVIVGFDRGWPFWTLAVALIIYNVLKAGLTWAVSPMRDEEERSGLTPPWTVGRNLSGAAIGSQTLPTWIPESLSKAVPDAFWRSYWNATCCFREYRFFYWIHHYVVRWVLWIAVVAFAINAYDWLSRTVWIPG